MPFIGPSAYSLTAALISAGEASLLRSAVKSTTETVGVGTRKAMPVNLPFSSGMTRPTAFAAPVLLGTMFWAAARASRRSLAAVSTVRWELVYAWIVVSRPFSIPNRSFSTLATGARPLVVHDAFEMTWCLAASYMPSLTPSTMVRSSFLAGAEMMTFLTPCSRCATALVASVKKPVLSMTTSTPSKSHGMFAGSFSAKTVIFLPPTTMSLSSNVTSPPL